MRRAISELASTSNAELCFIYYTGHAKKEHPEGHDTSWGNGGDWAGAWVLSRASIEEYPDQTLDDLLTISELLDTWEHAVTSRPGFDPAEAKPRLAILADTCFTFKVEEQLNEGTQRRRRDRLRVGFHPVRTKESVVGAVLDSEINL